MRAIVAVTVALLLTVAVAPDLEAARRAARQATWRGAAAAKLSRLRKVPRGFGGALGRAQAATHRAAGQVGDRIRRSARRQADRVARGGVFVGMGVMWLGVTQAAAEHQMKFVVGGIVLAAASAGVAWVRLVRDNRRTQRAFYEQYESVFKDHDRFRASGAEHDWEPGAEYQPPRPATRSAPRPPSGESWPADLVAVLEQLGSATSKEEVSRIYRAAAPRYHPDVGGNEEHSKVLNSFYDERWRDLK